MRNPLDILDQIQQAEAPPFLLTRIRQKIDSIQQTRFSSRLTWSLSFSMLVLLVINVAVMMKQSHTSSRNAGKNLAVSMNLVPDNSLYK